MKKIVPVTLQIALKAESDAKKITFSRTWTPSRTTLKLSAGFLALVDVKYLIASANQTIKDLFIGLPVLRHFGIDTNTLLQKHRDLLDGTDCLTVKPTNHGGNAGRIMRLMAARLNLVSKNAVAAIDKAKPTTILSPDTTLDAPPKLLRRESVDYFRVRKKQSPFRDSSILDPLKNDQKVEPGT